jgi:hypothetical protein
MPICRSSDTVSRSEMSVKRSIREVISVWLPNFNNSFGILSIPQALSALTFFFYFRCFSAVKFHWYRGRRSNYAIINTEKKYFYVIMQ